VIRVVVLGAAAGGGFPQWNSNSAACQRARRGDPAAAPRSQASLAVSEDGFSWFLLNASPDLRQQIAATPCLHPRAHLRSTPIAGVLLTGGEVDTVAGLLSLRERQPLRLIAAGPVHDLLDANPIFEALAHDVVPRERVALHRRFPLRMADGTPMGLYATLFPVPGKVPLYMEPKTGAPELDEADGTTTGVIVDDGARRLFYVPGCAAMTPALGETLRGADLVFFDGTLWRDDEMIRAGLGTKTGQRMGHMSVSGEQGAIAALAELQVRRKVLIHINNSNPVLLDDSPERQSVEAAGWEVAYDGMKVTLS
jgi:pyrroloquinoline quinone biosynthesis protein B